MRRMLEIPGSPNLSELHVPHSPDTRPRRRSGYVRSRMLFEERAGDMHRKRESQTILAPTY